MVHLAAAYQSCATLEYLLHELSPEAREAAAFQRATAKTARNQHRRPTSRPVSAAAGKLQRPHSSGSNMPLVPPSTPVPPARPASRSSAADRDVDLAAVGESDQSANTLTAEIVPELNAPDGSGRPPLFYAVSQHNMATAQYLIDAGVDLSARDRLGSVPCLLSIVGQNMNMP